MNAIVHRQQRFQNSSGKMPSDYAKARQAFELGPCGRTFKTLSIEEQSRLAEIALELVPKCRNGFGINQAAELISTLGLFIASKGREACHK